MEETRNLIPFTYRELSNTEKIKTMIIPQGYYLSIKNNQKQYAIVTPCCPCVALAIAGKNIDGKSMSMIFHVWGFNDLQDIGRVVSRKLIKKDLRASLFSKKASLFHFEVLRSNTDIKKDQEGWIGDIIEHLQTNLSIKKEFVKYTFLNTPEDDLITRTDRTVLIDGSFNDNDHSLNFFSCPQNNLLDSDQFYRFVNSYTFDLMKNKPYKGSVLPFLKISKEKVLQFQNLMLMLYASEDNKTITFPSDWDHFILHNIALESNQNDI